MIVVKLLFLIVIAFALHISAKTITLMCDEYMDEPTVEEDQIHSEKCTFSYVQFEAFDEVNISEVIVKELDYEGDTLEVDASNSIESVDFVNSRFPHLPKDLYTKFRNLKTVSCDGVNLNSLSKTDFKLALNLENFSCNSNYVKLLEKMLFNGSKRLQTLDLSINEIEDIDRTSFFGLESLKKLMLHDNKLKKLSEDVFEDLISLEEINLSSNQLAVVEEKLFENCKLLNYIYLNDNRIQQISDNLLLKIVEIKFLELSNNELSNLRLNVSASALYANHNHLTTVKLKSVGYLSFYNNSIAELDFEDKNGVISLNISTNNFSSLKSLADMKNMKSLDLSFNNLGSLSVSTFLDMPQLQILNLQSTNLAEIGFGLFTHQASLEQLDLSYNRLGGLELAKFTTLKALTTLFVEGNNFTAIDFKNIKTILPNLTLFGFSDNPWSCAYLSTLITSLHRDNIEVFHLVTEKMKSNVDGIACTESEKVNEDKSLSVNPIKHHHLVSDGNEMRAISEKFEVVLRHVNETSSKFATKIELINELNLIKNLVASLKQDMHEAKHKDNLTISDIKRVANDTMMNAMMRQKSDYDQKINGLNMKMESIEQSIDEIRNQLKSSSKSNTELEADDEKHQFSKIESPPTVTSDDSVTKLMVSVIFVIACGFTIIYIIKLYSRRNSRKFMVRRASSDNETLNENIL